jgi:4-amino-4-deoxy-L-arabinose transferase-like glycosyltransferase
VSIAVSASPMRLNLTVLGIVFLGLALRLWTVGTGLPFTPAIDEPVIMEKALHMMKSGDFNPHFFDYGGLTIYLQMAVASLRFADGALSREWTGLDRVWEGDFYLWARMATAILGSVTVYLVYRVGRRWSVTVALIAAFVAAIHPNMVREAHFALTDTPLTLFCTLTMLLSLVAGEDGRLRWFVLAGLTAGLATATKYNGSLALLMPICAAIASPGVSRRAASVIVAVLGLAGGFLVAAPYSLLDFPHFLDGFAELAQHYNKAQSGAGGAILYFKYLLLGFSFGSGWSAPFGWPALGLFLTGVVAAIAQLGRPDRRTASLILLVFPAVYFWLIAEQSLIFARYALPIVPMICLAIGVGIVATHDILRASVAALRTRDVALALLVIVAIPPAFQSIRFDYTRLKAGTDDVIARWLRRNVRPEDRIVGEVQAIRLPPEFHYEYQPRLARESLDAYRARGVTYLVFDAGVLSSPAGEAAAYRALMASTETAKTVEAGSTYTGPPLTVLRIPKP